MKTVKTIFTLLLALGVMAGGPAWADGPKVANPFGIPQPLIKNCKLEGGEYGLVSVDGEPLLKGNTFSNFKIAGLYAKGAHVPNLGNLNNAESDDDGGNVFILGDGRYYVRNDSASMLFAQGNDWGSNDGLLIDDTLFDDDENRNVGSIIFYPFSTGSLFSKTKLEPGSNRSDLLYFFEHWHSVYGDLKYDSIGHSGLRSDVNKDYEIDYYDLFSLGLVLDGKLPRDE